MRPDPNCRRVIRRRRRAALAVLATLGGCARAAPDASPPPATAAATPSVAAADPYHPPPRDTVDLAAYRGWQQYSLQCARCHGEDAQGSSFGPSLLLALGPEGHTPTREEFLDVLTHGRSDKGMPSAAKMGLDSTYFEGLYQYLKGRSDGRLHGGRPARREN
jgi:mono/diheme cytochrome c family protein